MAYGSFGVFSVSMYEADTKRLDELVFALKSRGISWANRSAVIRAAVRNIDLEQLAKLMGAR